MFVTFDSSKDGTSNAVSTSPLPNGAVKRKRVAVARACNWCRLNRVRCDDCNPCQSCRTRNLQCSKGLPSDPANSTAAADLREIERLRSRATELEEQLKKATREADAAKSLVTPEQPPASKWHWPGVWIHTPQNSNSLPQYYGPTSFMYFTSRICNHVELSLNQPRLSSALQSFTVNRMLSATLSEDSSQLLDILTRSQEESLLSLFWQSFHTTVPIIDETEFCAHYDSLWRTASNPNSISDSVRTPSPLVDIVLALCVQHSANLMASGDTLPTMSLESRDLSSAGDWLYRRCQRLQSNDKDSLSLSALQCWTFSVIYLWNASSLNLAHRMLVTVVHMAYAIGLHHNSPKTPSLSHQALGQRIWCSLVSLDTMLSLALGRPTMISHCDVNINISRTPESFRSETMATGSGDVNMLDYFTQYIKLTAAFRNISTMIFQKGSELMAVCETDSSIYSEPAVVEKCATYLHQSMESLRTWAGNVPACLKLARKGSVEPFSTSRAPLDIDVYQPLWLQRQRVLLELLYHNLIMSLYRMFMKIPSSAVATASSVGSTIPKTSNRNALYALNHAVTTISIIHQILTETDILNCWHSAYQYAWDATLTILAFILVNPVCPYTFSARRAVTSAIDTFNLFSQNGFTTAAMAATITKEMSSAVDSITQSFRSGLTSSPQTTLASQDRSSDHSTHVPLTPQTQPQQSMQSFPHTLEFIRQQFSPSRASMSMSASSPHQNSWLTMLATPKGGSNDNDKGVSDNNMPSLINGPASTGTIGIDLETAFLTGTDQSWFQNEWYNGMAVESEVEFQRIPSV
ncbi:hypothetical protein BGW36DRAFT_431978 [Talaromyces proteolyticus]|uniref:Zn(2)-C6 fungal-type domain-containing protein n=1 Tax=Talaromyces proteolyticus TaxID=1131652 RepID=A0AAD4KHR2_9EURO|nr:uncharacterized protein BGW36DRAFT_431978 [Talaromyces proteolyticus]KAH8691429.1 hypothetical protein BGW36DRAFT_431978 [Talaromyces proteolyticus]